MARKPNDCRWLDRRMDCCRNTATHPNSWEQNGMTIFAEPKCLRCDGCGYEPITPDAPAWDDERRPRMDKHSPTPWRVENINQTYHVAAADGGFVALFVSEADAALIVEAVNERDRLRDIVRRLEDEYEQLEERDTVCDTNRTRRIEALFREALGEAQ